MKGVFSFIHHLQEFTLTLWIRKECDNFGVTCNYLVASRQSIEGPRGISDFSFQFSAGRNAKMLANWATHIYNISYNF